VSFKITAFDNAGNMATEDNAGKYYVYNVIPEFTLIALLSFIIILTLIIVYAKRKSVDTKSPSAPVRKCA
jgi:hypothetical protein